MQMMFQLLTLVGAVTLFLFGLSLLSVGLQKVAGDGLRSFLASLTSNGFKRLLTGVGVTAAIQSSTATTIMVVSFVNAGLHSACANNFTSFGMISRLSTEMSFALLAEYSIFAKPPATGAC